MLTLVVDNTSTIAPTLTPSETSPDTERALADLAAAQAAGFSPKPPVYAIGTSVNAIGEQNFRQSRRTFEALPFATDACGSLAETVEAERRADLVVDAPSLLMLPDGRLVSDFGSLSLSERALDGLGRLVTPGGASYLASCPPSLRATNVNHWLKGARRVDKAGSVLPRQLTLRARQTSSGCEIFSVVGPRYSPLDIDVIATQVHGIVPKDARAEVLYDGYRARISVLYHSNIQPERCVAGELFKAGVSITTADDGTGAIRIAAQVWRNLCKNLIVIDRSEQTMAVRHVGPNLGNVVSAASSAP